VVIGNWRFSLGAFPLGSGPARGGRPFGLVLARPGLLPLRAGISGPGRVGDWGGRGGREGWSVSPGVLGRGSRRPSGRGAGTAPFGQKTLITDHYALGGTWRREPGEAFSNAQELFREGSRARLGYPPFRRSLSDLRFSEKGGGWCAPRSSTRGRTRAFAGKSPSLTIYPAMALGRLRETATAQTDVCASW